MHEELSSETVYDSEAFTSAMEKIQDMLESGNFRGTGTRRDGLKGDIESAFGWHAGEPGQPVADNSITDEMRGRWLEKLLPREVDIKAIEAFDQLTMKENPYSSPEEIIRWMENKKRELLGEEPTEEEKERRAQAAETIRDMLADSTGYVAPKK